MPDVGPRVRRLASLWVLVLFLAGTVDVAAWAAPPRRPVRHAAPRKPPSKRATGTRGRSARQRPARGRAARANPSRRPARRTVSGVRGQRVRGRSTRAPASSGRRGRVSEQRKAAVKERLGSKRSSLGSRQPFWSTTSKLTRASNALVHYRKHGPDFPHLKGAKQYVEAARRFVRNPPKGTLMRQRARGDVVLYHPASNTFAVRAPRRTAAPQPRSP